MEIDKIKEIIQLMKEADLKVFELKDKGEKLYLEAHSKDVSQVSEKQALPIQNNIEANKNDLPKENNPLVEIRSNQIGVFYTQPEEDSKETFVSEGDFVKAGDQIGLIEIMKLFNEVTVEQTGTIEKILVSNGEAVEYDQVLMLLKVEEE